MEQQRNSLQDYHLSQGASGGRGGSGGSRGGSRGGCSVPAPVPTPVRSHGHTASSSLGSTGREEQQQQRDRSRSPSLPRPSAQVEAAHEAARAPFYGAIRDILEEPGHELLPHLHPQRPPRTLWFTDSSVASAVTDVFEKDYQDPFTKRRDVTEPVLQRWFYTFARKYHWQSGFTSRVYHEFIAKVHDRLPDMVYRWKQQWLAKGDAARPLHWDPDVWAGMVAKWLDPDHQRRSGASKSARGKSKNSTHRSGRTSYAARGRMIAEERGDSETDLLAVLEYAKRRPDGTFMDDDSEELYNDVNSKLQELTQNDDPDSVASASSVAVKNKLFVQSAPRRKGKIWGVGSLQSQIDIGSGSVCGSASSQFPDPFEVAELKNKLDATETKLDATETKLTATQSKVEAFEEIFDYLGNLDPKLQEILSRIRQNQQQNEGGPSGGGSDEF